MLQRQPMQMASASGMVQRAAARNSVKKSRSFLLDGRQRVSECSNARLPPLALFDPCLPVPGRFVHQCWGCLQALKMLWKKRMGNSRGEQGHQAVQGGKRGMCAVGLDRAARRGKRGGGMQGLVCGARC